MAVEDFPEHVTEVGRDGEVATLVALLTPEAGPLAVDTSAPDAPADDHHGVAVPVIGASIAVLTHRSPEFRHRQDNRVGHAIAQVLHESGKAAREVVEPDGKLSLCRALIHMGVPPTRFRKRDLETDVRLRKLRDLPQRLPERTRRIVGPVFGW